MPKYYQWFEIMTPEECLVRVRPYADRILALVNTMPPAFWLQPHQARYIHVVSLSAGIVHGLTGAAILGYDPRIVPTSDPELFGRYLRSVACTLDMSQPLGAPERSLWRGGFHFNAVMVRLVTLVDIYEKTQQRGAPRLELPALNKIKADRRKLVHEPPGTLPRTIGYEELVDTFGRLVPTIERDFAQRLAAERKRGRL